MNYDRLRQHFIKYLMLYNEIFGRDPKRSIYLEPVADGILIFYKDFMAFRGSFPAKNKLLNRDLIQEYKDLKESKPRTFLFQAVSDEDYPKEGVIFNYETPKDLKGQIFIQLEKFFKLVNPDIQIYPNSDDLEEDIRVVFSTREALGSYVIIILEQMLRRLSPSEQKALFVP